MTAPYEKGPFDPEYHYGRLSHRPGVRTPGGDLASARQEASLIAAGRSAPTRTCATAMNANAATADGWT
jgi:hypothetical protein